MTQSAFQIDKGHDADTFRKRDVFVRDGHNFWTGAAVRWDPTVSNDGEWVLASSEDPYQAEAIGVATLRLGACVHISCVHACVYRSHACTRALKKTSPEWFPHSLASVTDRTLNKQRATTSLK